MDQIHTSTIPASGASGTTTSRVVFIIVGIWALLQVVRLSAFSLVQSVLAGQDAGTWLFPAYMDIFIGIMAPIIAFMIWRKTGLGVWVTILVWFVLSITDHLDALTAALTSQIPPSLSMGSSTATAAFLLALTVLDIGALILLTRTKTKMHYVGLIR